MSAGALCPRALLAMLALPVTYGAAGIVEDVSVEVCMTVAAASGDGDTLRGDAKSGGRASRAIASWSAEAAAGGADLYVLYVLYAGGGGACCCHCCCRCCCCCCCSCCESGVTVVMDASCAAGWLATG